MDDIETKVLKHIDSLSIAEPSLDESFSDLRMDSLDIVELLMGIEKEFNLPIPNEYLSEDKKGRDIVNYVKSHIDNHKKYPIDTDLKDKLVKYFSAIEGMADELTTGNVAHKKAAIKGFAGRAKEYLIKHT